MSGPDPGTVTAAAPSSGTACARRTTGSSPPQRPDGVIPWLTPLLTFAIWVPLAWVAAVLFMTYVTHVPLSTGDASTVPAHVGIVLAVVWAGKIRHVWNATFAGFLAWLATDLLLRGLGGDNVTDLIRTFFAALADAWVSRLP